MATTLRLFAANDLSIPASTSWYLADLGEFRGKQELYTQQSPQRLTGEFTVSQVEQACPGVSKDMVRRVLREQQKANTVECHGRGPAARWNKKV